MSGVPRIQLSETREVPTPGEETTKGDGMNKDLQAKDISAESFLAAIREDCRRRSLEWGHETSWGVTWNVADILGIPTKVANAKAKALIRQGIITGCTCGCRGDLEIVEKS